MRGIFGISKLEVSTIDRALAGRQAVVKPIERKVFYQVPAYNSEVAQQPTKKVVNARNLLSKIFRKH